MEKSLSLTSRLIWVASLPIRILWSPSNISTFHQQHSTGISRYILLRICRWYYSLLGRRPARPLPQRIWSDECTKKSRSQTWPRKYAFGMTKRKYLGFIIEAWVVVKVDPDKVQAISEWEEPSTVSQVRSFLGFSNFYREFISHFSSICEPLNYLTKRGMLWQWGKLQKNIFERLKEFLMSAPILIMFDPEAETLLETNSWGYAIGGLLSQVDEKGCLRPVGFFSRKIVTGWSEL